MWYLDMPQFVDASIVGGPRDGDVVTIDRNFSLAKGEVLLPEVSLKEVLKNPEKFPPMNRLPVGKYKPEWWRGRMYLRYRETS